MNDAAANYFSAPSGKPKELHGECQDHGKFTVDAIYFQGKLRNPDPTCPLCVAASDRELLEKEKEVQLTVMKREYLLDSGIPLLMQGKHIRNYKAVNKTAAAHKETCRKFVDSWIVDRGKRKNLIFCGRPGNGKTHLACAVGQGIISEYQERVRYATSADMTRYIREAFGSKDYNESQAIARFADVPLLILDEVGVDSDTGFSRRKLFEVVDKRYQNLLPTFVISNLGISEIEKATDERMVDRLSDNGTALTFDWDSFRGSS